MTDYTIELARMGDCENLSVLARATFTQAFGHLYSAENLGLFLDEYHKPENYEWLMHNNAYEIWAARDAFDVMIGYSVGGPCTLPVPQKVLSKATKPGELVRLYVDQHHQNKRIGKMLMEKTCDWLEARFDWLYISVYADNHGAQRFYQRYGFQNIHEYGYRVGRHIDREFIFERGPL